MDDAISISISISITMADVWQSWALISEPHQHPDFKPLSIKTVFPSCELLSVCFLIVPLPISKLSFLSVASLKTLFQAFQAEHMSRLRTCRDKDISEPSRGMYVAGQDVRAVRSVGQSRSGRTAAAVTTVACWWENPAIQQLGGDTLPQTHFSFLCAVDLHCCEWQTQLVKLVALSLQDTAPPTPASARPPPLSFCSCGSSFWCQD